MIEGFFEPGVLVRHPMQPDWGIGQVQTVDKHRITVMFEEAGKQVIDLRYATLDYIGPDPRANAH